MPCTFLDVCLCGHIRDEHEASGFFQACQIDGCAPVYDEAGELGDDTLPYCDDFSMETEHVEEED